MSKKEIDKNNKIPLTSEEILEASSNDTNMDIIHENDESFFQFVDAKIVESDLEMRSQK